MRLWTKVSVGATTALATLAGFAGSAMASVAPYAPSQGVNFGSLETDLLIAVGGAVVIGLVIFGALYGIRLAVKLFSRLGNKG